MHQKLLATAVACLLSVVLCCNSASAIDLRNATVERLDNGLTVILLEDRSFPVVSVQMLYRIGARDESYGQTGIAHFLEHMAFRASENFPGTGLVSSIYAVGGEWHGYTWTDQTTYFATVPKGHLELLLRIEADRMTRLSIAEEDMEAERGAVLAEMHMYENYPTSVLLDALLFTSFFAHPYRNNTIGWESDIENLRHEQVVAFYEQHYHPANAVLAVVGDFDVPLVLERIRDLFGDAVRRAPTPWPHTVEPRQEGERRVLVYGHTDEQRFMIGYRAPSANHEDYPAFLVLQELLGAGSGVNFRQNDWGTPVDHRSLLSGAANELTTWYPPSAQDYVFVIGGTIGKNADRAQLEEEIEQRLATVRREAPDGRAVSTAIERVLDELVYDVETTEDAAHQLAFFDGLHALDVLLGLPQRVAAVSAGDVQRLARTWLLPEQRTIGWHVPDERRDVPPDLSTHAPDAATNVTPAPRRPVNRDPVGVPAVRRLGGGIPAIVQRSGFSSSAFLQVVVPGIDHSAEGVLPDTPISGHSSFSYRFRPAELQRTVTRARDVLRTADVSNVAVEADSDDPETRLEQIFRALIDGGDRRRKQALAPSLVVVSGDIDEARVFEALEAEFGGMAAASVASGQRRLAREDIEVHLDRQVAQAQLGYIVPAPGPAEDSAYAWRILLYILSHDYEGRLGREAISDRGLAYFIDSRYRSDGNNGWITLAAGVDPGKVDELRELLRAQLQGLRENPPTAEEIEEARRHFLGRARSASLSNRELAGSLAANWLWYGDLPTPDALERQLGQISRQDVLEVVAAFSDGITVVAGR